MSAPRSRSKKGYLQQSDWDYAADSNEFPWNVAARREAYQHFKRTDPKGFREFYRGANQANLDRIMGKQPKKVSKANTRSREHLDSLARGTPPKSMRGGPLDFKNRQAEYDQWIKDQNARVARHRLDPIHPNPKLYIPTHILPSGHMRGASGDSAWHTKRGREEMIERGLASRLHHSQGLDMYPDHRLLLDPKQPWLGELHPHDAAKSTKPEIIEQHRKDALRRAEKYFAQHQPEAYRGKYQKVPRYFNETEYGYRERMKAIQAINSPMKMYGAKWDKYVMPDRHPQRRSSRVAKMDFEARVSAVNDALENLGGFLYEHGGTIQNQRKKQQQRKQQQPRKVTKMLEPTGGKKKAPSKKKEKAVAKSFDNMAVTMNKADRMYLTRRYGSDFVPVSKIEPVTMSIANLAANYGINTHRGMNLRDIEEEKYRKGSTKNKELIGRAAGDPRFVHRGNQVYARNRRLFPAQGEQFIQQTVRDAKGNKHKTYLQIGHPGTGIGGLTRWDEDRPMAHIKGNPTWSGKPTKQLRNKFMATHEMQHAKEYAGKGRGRKELQQKLERTYRTNPERSTARELLGGAYARSMAFNRTDAETRGISEGSADKIAGLLHGIHPAMVSGYPAMAKYEPNFGRGYYKGGGPVMPGRHQRKQEKANFKRRALEQ